MKRILSIAAVAAITVALSCGNGEKPAPKAAGSRTATPAASVANVPAGWPAETFTELTKPEMDAYANVLPTVIAALKQANFEPCQSKPPDLVKDMGTTIDAIETAAGVKDALKAGGMSWDAFRTTTYKIMAATEAMVVATADSLESEIGDSTSEAAGQVRAMVAAAKPALDQVPERNGEIVLAYADQLKPLDAIDGTSR